MRRKEPLEVESNWKHPLPMPMPFQPVCVTELEAIEQVALLTVQPRIFMWTDLERRCINSWEFLASVRQGVPPQGIEAELNAWMEQYPTAWRAVDLRDGVMMPSTSKPIEEFLAELPRPVMVIVSRDSQSEIWPNWVLPQ